jgi:tetratricopeptide (TPR) repeat protein
MRQTSPLKAFVGAVIALLAAACATPPERPAPAAVESPPPRATTAPPAVQPRLPETPASRAPTAEERQRAEQLANDSVLQLQAGDAGAGRTLLDQALGLDPNNELARMMMQQMTADPATELGATHFTYTIQREDTLARLAQRFLGDRLKFYILARYNDISQPNRIHVGQVIKIPGKAPPRGTEPASVEPARPVPPVAQPPVAQPPVAQPPAPVDDAVSRRLAEAGELERKGDLEGALNGYADVLRRDPNHAGAQQRATAARKRLVDRHYADGTAAFARQDLDKAIASWDRVLALDPEHANARLKRQQALDLKERLKRFDKKQP